MGKLRGCGSFLVAMVLMLILQIGILGISPGTAVAENTPTPADQQITLLVSGRFSITVKASLPTPGYKWEIAFDERLLKLIKRHTPSGTDIIGASGVETLDFEGIKAGETEIYLNYNLSLDPVNPRLETRTFNVVILSPTPPPIWCPVINSFTTSPGIRKGASSVLRWSVSNAASINIDNGIGNVTSSGTLTVSPATSADYTLQASNGGNTIAQTVTVNVTPAPPASPNCPPIVHRIVFINPDSAQISIKPNTTPPALSSRIWAPADITCFAIDSDDDDLDYNWSTDSGKIQGEGFKIKWIAPGIIGDSVITVTVVDSNGASTSFSIKVRVYCLGNGCPAPTLDQRCTLSSTTAR